MKSTSIELGNSNQLRLIKTSIIVGLTVFVVVVPFVVVTIGASWFQRQWPQHWWMVPTMLMGLLGAFAPLVYLAFIRRLEGKLLTDQRRYHRTLIAASSGMTQIKDIETLSRLIVHVVNRTVGLNNTALFIYEPKEQRYSMQSVRYPSRMVSGLTVAQNDPLVELLQEQKDLLVVDELQSEIEAKQPDEQAKKAAWAYSWLQKLNARLVVPSFSGDKLLAFLVLSSKRSGDRYSTDDIAIFSGLANQGALAIENAMFFEELRNNEAYMIQSEKLASLGQLASGMAHEIHNPLTIISGEAQLYLERFRGKDDSVDSVLKSIIEECQRAADITRRILRFAKPAPSDLAPLEVKTVLDETIMLAGYQVRMEKVERTVNVEPGLPKVRANQNQLQEVILNLILNACQAMGEKGGKLQLLGQALNGGTIVQIQIADNGPGIPLAKLKKVFDPFYTTKATGTGLGLFVSERIIKAHGGTIEVDSTEGKGACFTIRLPAWKESDTAAATKTSAAGSSR